jgi:hypothetical protein
MEKALFDLDSAAEVDQALQAPWYERGFLTDAEALGGEGLGPGLLAGSVSVGALRILQERRWIKAWVGRLAPRGKRRLWPISHLLRAQLAVDVADGLSVSFVTAVAILRSISEPVSDGTTEVPFVVDDLVREWRSRLVAKDGGADGQPTKFLETFSGAAGGVEADPTGVRVHLVDRRLVLLTGGDGNIEIKAVARSLQSTGPDIEPINDLFRDEEVVRRIGWASVQSAEPGAILLDHALSVSSVNLSESLRQFLRRTSSAGGKSP